MNFEQKQKEDDLSLKEGTVLPEVSPEALPLTETEEIKELDLKSDAEIASFDEKADTVTPNVIGFGEKLGFTSDEVTSRMESSGTNSALSGIKDSASELYKSFKKIMAVGVLASMATTAEAQSAKNPTEELQTTSAQEQVVAGTPSSNERAHIEVKKDNPQRKAFESYDEYQKYVKAHPTYNLEGESEFDKLKIEAELNYIDADEQREWLAGIVHSKEYADKGKKFEGLSDKEIERRRDIAVSDKVRIQDQHHPLDAGVAGEYTPYNSGRPELEGKYILSPHTYLMNEPVAIHEGEHAITDDNKYMSRYAKNLYKEAYRPLSSDAKEDNEYFSNPTEMNARKRVLEYELEQKGIWKYGETFTKDHLKKAIELMNQDKLSEGTTDFLKRIKLKNLPKIMNTIAGKIDVTPENTQQDV